MKLLSNKNFECSRKSFHTRVQGGTEITNHIWSKITNERRGSVYWDIQNVCLGFARLEDFNIWVILTNKCYINRYPIINHYICMNILMFHMVCVIAVSRRVCCLHNRNRWNYKRGNRFSFETQDCAYRRVEVVLNSYQCSKTENWNVWV